MVTLSERIADTSDQLALGLEEVPISEWNALIDANLFGLRGDHPGVTGRTLMSFLMRRASSHAFNEPTRSFPRQAEADATTNLAYLIGLDWQLAGRYKDIAARDATRKQLRGAVNDPMWGQIVGSTADLRGQIAIAEQRVERLRSEIADFRIVPEYEHLKDRADGLAREIRELSEQDVIARANLDYLSQAIQETREVDTGYLGPIYEEVGVVLGDQVRKRPFTGVQQGWL